MKSQISLSKENMGLSCIGINESDPKVEKTPNIMSKSKTNPESLNPVQPRKEITKETSNENNNNLIIKFDNINSKMLNINGKPVEYILHTRVQNRVRGIF